MCDALFKKSLTYCLLVTGPAYGTQKAISAWRFANALITEEHILKTVFFYREGVYNGNQLLSPASDEFNLLISWKTLAQQTGCQLHICIAAALRRGIIDETEAQNNDLPFANLDKDFTLSGLGTLAQAMIFCDRTVQF
ncbi:MAG: sulfurtransferase complex subunit TusD [Candidatus Arsenophonus melophagi]|nr:sulfurtransferase complex subunit TusD [Candidatus Arsenophonus melophagi]